MIAPLSGALQQCGHLLNQDLQQGGPVEHLHHADPRHGGHASHLLHDVQQGGLSKLLLHGEPRLDVQQDGLVDRLLHAVPRNGVHLGVFFTNSSVMVASSDFSFMWDCSTTQACFYFLIYLLLS